MPVEPDTVDDSQLSGKAFTVAGMTSLVAAVRATGAKQPLLLGGLNYSNDLTGWLAHAPTPAPSKGTSRKRSAAKSGAVVGMGIPAKLLDSFDSTT